MKIFKAFCLLLLTTLVGGTTPSLPTPSRSGGDSKERHLALVGAKIYPSPTEKPIFNGVVLIEGGRIIAVGANGKAKVPSDAKVLDCTGLTMTAGFWNNHVHLADPKWQNAGGLTSSQLTQQFQEMLTRYGFTTVFDTGSFIENTKVIRKRIEAGEVAGPRVLTAGEPIYPKDGLPGYVRELRIKLPEAASPEQATLLVREKVSGGADAVKIFAGSWVGGDSVVAMPLDVIQAITSEARRHGKLVLAHPQNAAGLQVAVEGGVDVLVHTAPDAGEWGKALLARMKQSKIALIPTLKLWRVELQKAGKSTEAARRFQAVGVGQLRAYSKAGGQILFGTDVGYMADYDTAEEYLLMEQAGMDFRQILAALTTAPTERFGVSKRIGRIAPGMDADVVLLTGDPANEIRAFSNVRYTIRQGLVIYRSN